MGEQLRVHRKGVTTSPQPLTPAAPLHDASRAVVSPAPVVAQDFARIAVLPQATQQETAAPERVEAALSVEGSLLLSQPGDPSEREASAIATRVLQPGPPLAPGEITTHARPGELGRQATENAVETDARSPAIDAALASEGRSLDQATRDAMEPRFGHSFADVRVHTDGHAAESARAIDAFAYTIGRDIIFGAGQYAPDTNSGQRLLAHELTHVVQQRGSGAQDLGLVVQRDGTTTPANVGATQPVPFTPPDGAIQVDPEALLYDVVRARVGDLINLSYTAYESAITRVQAEILAKGQEAAEKQAAVMSLVATAGLALIPASSFLFASARIASIPADTRGVMFPLLAKGGIRGAAADKAIDAVDLAAPKLAEKATPENLKAGFDAAIGKVAATKTPVEGTNRYALTIAYLDKLGKTAFANVQQLLTADFSHNELLGLYVAYTAPSLRETYLSDVRTRADNFLLEVAGVKERPGKEEIVKMDAYGRMRYARVIRSTGSPVLFESYPVFIAWITPDMQPMVEQEWPDARLVDPQKISGHIPDPVAGYGKRIVEIDAWGHPRLAEVTGDDGKYYFGHWVTKDGEAAARAKGALQVGGLNRLNGDQVSGMSKPTPEEEQ